MKSPGKSKRRQFVTWAGALVALPAVVLSAAAAEPGGLTAGAGRADALRHFQAQLQLLVRYPGGKGLLPTEGRSNRRHFVWVWALGLQVLAWPATVAFAEQGCAILAVVEQRELFAVWATVRLSRYGVFSTIM